MAEFQEDRESKGLEDRDWTEREEEEIWPRDTPSVDPLHVTRIVPDQEWGASVRLSHERFRPPVPESLAEEREWGAATGLARERNEAPGAERVQEEDREWGAATGLPRERDEPPPEDRENL